MSMATAMPAAIAGSHGVPCAVASFGVLAGEVTRTSCGGDVPRAAAFARCDVSMCGVKRTWRESRARPRERRSALRVRSPTIPSAASPEFA